MGRKPKVGGGKGEKTQAEQFIETARRVGADETGEAFERAFKRIALSTGSASEKNSKGTTMAANKEQETTNLHFALHRMKEAAAKTPWAKELYNRILTASDLTGADPAPLRKAIEEIQILSANRRHSEVHMLTQKALSHSD